MLQGAYQLQPIIPTHYNHGNLTVATPHKVVICQVCLQLCPTLYARPNEKWVWVKKVWQVRPLL